MLVLLSGCARNAPPDDGPGIVHLLPEFQPTDSVARLEAASAAAERDLLASPERWEWIGGEAIPNADAPLAGTGPGDVTVLRGPGGLDLDASVVGTVDVSAVGRGISRVSVVLEGPGEDLAEALVAGNGPEIPPAAGIRLDPDEVRRNRIPGDALSSPDDATPRGRLLLVVNWTPGARDRRFELQALASLGAVDEDLGLRRLHLGSENREAWVTAGGTTLAAAVRIPAPGRLRLSVAPLAGGQDDAFEIVVREGDAETVAARLDGGPAETWTSTTWTSRAGAATTCRWSSGPSGAPGRASRGGRPS